MAYLWYNGLRDKRRNALSEIIDELNSSLNIQIKQVQCDLRPLDAVVMQRELKNLSATTFLIIT